MPLYRELDYPQRTDIWKGLNSSRLLLLITVKVFQQTLPLWDSDTFKKKKRVKMNEFYNNPCIKEAPVLQRGFKGTSGELQRIIRKHSEEVAEK